MEKEKSKGLGDTIEKFTKATGIKKAVDVITKAVGIEDCGCNRRKGKLNRLITYKQTNPTPTPYSDSIIVGEDYIILSNITNIIDGKENRVLKNTIIKASNKNKTELEGYLIAGLLKKI